MLVALTLLIPACGPGDEIGPSALQLTGVDFQLNSIIIENTASADVRTENMWIYRDGEAYELGIFTIAPRAAILFSMRQLGDISVSRGEVALNESGDFDDPDSMLAYVAWGTGDRELATVATGAGLWPADETAETMANTLILIRTDLTGTGPAAWEALSDIG